MILLKTKKHIFSFGINNKLYKTLTGNVIAVVQDDPAPVDVAVVAMKIKMTFVKNN